MTLNNHTEASVLNPTNEPENAAHFGPWSDINSDINNHAGSQGEIPSEPYNQVEYNVQALEREMAWFYQVLETRLSLYFQNDCDYHSIEQVPMPDFTGHPSHYARLVAEHNMSMGERLLFILTIIPHLRPQLLNLLLIHDPTIDKPYVEFGGWRGATHGGFLPTGETAAFLIAGEDLSKRIHVFSLLERDHFFTRTGMLKIKSGSYEEAYLTAPLVLSHEYFHRVTIGSSQKPDFSMHFPAKLVETKLAWRDLVLPPNVLDEVEHIHTWLAHQDKIMYEMGFEKSIKPGYRALFYGPPGTGKTLTASLLGKSTGMDVYRIDLSAVVSKFIGETEKNLEAIFMQAETRNWILFFDEADALFGKRTETSSSNDRHANQEVAYLLQRIETFPGIVILATNLKSNIDDAFIRRFQSMIFFPMPDVDQRLNLWEKALNNSACVAPDTDLKRIAKDYELAGGSIINVIRFAAITALKDQRSALTHEDIILGIKKEQRKQGRIL